MEKKTMPFYSQAQGVKKKRKTDGCVTISGSDIETVTHSQTEIEERISELTNLKKTQVEFYKKQIETMKRIYDAEIEFLN